MNPFEFIHREMKLLFDYQDKYGEFHHDEIMQERQKLYEKLESWLDKGFLLQTNAGQGGLEEVRDCET